MQAKKSLGQNFLTSIPARIAIVAAGHLTREDTVLEIGPGRGFLTRGLLDTGARITALEKDRDLLPILEESFSQELISKQLTLLEGDVLTFDPQSHGLQSSGYKIIANIPYYITGAILSRYLSHTTYPTQMVVLVQKEVAERIVARDGKESILSLSVKCYGEPRIVYRVNKGSFNPAPTVDSAVLSIENISKKNFSNQYHEELFFKAVKAGFSHKRKLLASNLQDVFTTIKIRELFEALSIPPKARAEDVTLATWLLLSLSIATAS
jgi:16S rRNA (adenine1518-N6/adenine1519-N6)-dimethyltransferase